MLVCEYNELAGLIFQAPMNHSSKCNFQSPLHAREVKLLSFPVDCTHDANATFWDH